MSSGFCFFSVNSFMTGGLPRLLCCCFLSSGTTYFSRNFSYAAAYQMSSSTLDHSLPRALPRIGWIGLGIMGKPMCQHCIKAGYQVAVYNRSWDPVKMESLAALNPKICNSAAEVASESDLVVSIVTYPKDVEAVASEVISNLKPGSVYIDMSTSRPELAKQLFEKALKRGVHSLDAPVSGGDIGARDGMLSIMCGGDEKIFQQVYPVFKTMGRNIRYMGTAGMGQHAKMTNQIVIATAMIGIVEALLYAHKAGLDLVNTLEVISTGAAASWSLSNLAPRILKRNFAPGVSVDIFLKDLEIALDECRGMQLALPGLALAHQLFVALKAQDGEKQGTHALACVLERMNNVQIREYK